MDIINWDDPAARLKLIEKVGTEKYNTLLALHRKNSVIAHVGGHAISKVNSRFGELYSVGNTGTAYASFKEATHFAKLDPNPSVETTTFEHECMCVHNAMISECGRFDVSPEHYGFAVTSTGGGCLAWQKRFEDGTYLLITDHDGIHLPDTWQDALIGRYDSDGSTLVAPHPLTFEAVDEGSPS